MGDSFQFYLDLLLIWLLLIDVCVLAANVINRYTKEPSRYGERSFMKYCVAALVALFVAVVLYSFLHPEVRRPIIELPVVLRSEDFEKRLSRESPDLCNGELFLRQYVFLK